MAQSAFKTKSGRIRRRLLRRRRLKITGGIIGIFFVAFIVVANLPEEQFDIEGALSMGEPHSIGDVEITLQRAYVSRGTDVARPPRGHSFTIGVISLTNNGDQPVTASPDDFNLIVDGEYMNWRNLHYVVDYMIDPIEVDSNEQINFRVGWAAPSGVTPQFLEYAPQFSDEEIVIRMEGL